MDKKIILAAVILVLLGTSSYLFNDRHSRDTASEKSSLIIGTHAKYPPMESRDENGNFVGMDIEIAKEVAKDLGRSAVFQDIAWENIFDAVRNGEVDMIISSITITQERGESMNFSDPYFNAGQVIVALKEDKFEIRTPQDLSGKKVGAQSKTTSEKEVKKYTDKFVALENNYEGKELLLSGDVEALVMDYPTAVELVGKDKRLAIASEIFTQEFYGIATRKGNDELLTSINKTIRRLKRDGDLKRIITNESNDI
jgi:ABC-type amino acid transport substrate-binding protein